MKIFEINNNSLTIAYLLYSETDKNFYIELKDKLKISNVPIFFDYYINHNIKTIDSYYSYLWVLDRIIPSNRQNINELMDVLKIDNYDEFSFLYAYKGKSCQDDLVINPISYDDIDNGVKNRLNKRILDIVPCNDNKLILFLIDGDTRIVSIEKLVKNDTRFSLVLNDYDFFNKVEIQSFGMGVKWGNNLIIDFEQLYKASDQFGISIDVFNNYSKRSFLETSDVCNELNCSRQGVFDLVKRNKIKHIRKNKNNSFFSRSDINIRKWKVS